MSLGRTVSYRRRKTNKLTAFILSQRFVQRLVAQTKWTNLFETIIRKKSDVISSIVDCDYSYNLRIEIPRKTVEDFLEWFRNSTPQSQALILNNFISKISDIRVEEPEPELPF